MLSIVLGNVFTFIAACFAVVNGTRKSKKEMLWCDIGSATFYTVSDLFLKGYSGAVQNVVGILRDLTALFLPDIKYTKWILVAIGVILGIYFNNRGILGLFPVVTACYYSICAIDKNCSVERFKIALILNCTGFAIYDFVINNYVGLLLDSFTAITTLISLIKNHTKENKDEMKKENKLDQEQTNKVSGGGWDDVKKYVKPTGTYVKPVTTNSSNSTTTESEEK